MVSVTIFIEGGATGPDSKYLQLRCREGFHKLISKLSLDRSPSLKVCGSRGNAFRMFQVGHKKSQASQFVALLIDSEDPISDVEKTWEHLTARDSWESPQDATNEQVLLMTTCMESWIATDRQALQSHYGASLQESALPSQHAMESRDRHSVQSALAHATRNCKNRYEKGKRSFEILSELSPERLIPHLQSFARVVRILLSKSGPQASANDDSKL